MFAFDFRSSSYELKGLQTCFYSKDTKTLFVKLSRCLKLMLFSHLFQSLFRAWLAENEEALSEVQTSNFKDPSEMNSNVRRLAVSYLPSLRSCHARYFNN